MIIKVENGKFSVIFFLRQMIHIEPYVRFAIVSNNIKRKSILLRTYQSCISIMTKRKSYRIVKRIPGCPKREQIHLSTPLPTH
jgi:hypothetical protein